MSMKSMMMMPPEVAQPQLPRDGDRGLEVGAENRLFQIAMADERAGVHVDRGHRFGLVDDQIAARLQRHLAVQGLLNLLLDVLHFEQGARIGVQLDARQCVSA
jgi:hypothetical protein